MGTVVAAGYGRGCLSRLFRGDGGGAPRAFSSAHAGSAARSATAAAAASVNPFAAATTLSAPVASSDASGDADDARGTKAARRTRRPSRARRSRGARRVRESREATALDAISRCVVARRDDRVALSGRKRRTRHRVSVPARQLDCCGQSQKMKKLSSHSQSSVYVLCFAAASRDAPSSSRTARRCIAPLAANPKPRPVPAVVGARRPRASSIPSARLQRE